MSKPWDVRSRLPDQGDPTDDVTYAAVGRALSRWEKLEVELAGLYAILTGRSKFDMTAIRAYGSGRIFADRMTGLATVACPYFVRNSGQKEEAAFESIVCRARKLSARRNDIAHGIVNKILRATVDYRNPVGGSAQVLTSDNFCLMPPHYDPRRRNQTEPKYSYSSQDMNEYGGHFAALALEVDQFTSQIASS
jgi:hypothetical protein